MRKVYVDEAFAMARKAGGKATVTSISAQTGLSRKEVKRLKELEADTASTNNQKYNRAVRVISGWLNDRNYSNRDGQALPLPLTSETEKSFTHLVKDYSGDITPKSMLDLLSNSGCVQVIGQTVQLVKHAYVPGNDSEEILKILGIDAAELISTIDHNLTCGSDENYFQRKVSTSTLKKSEVGKFEEYSRQRAQALLEELDSWLDKHSSTDENDDTQYVSLGIYYYQPEMESEER